MEKDPVRRDKDTMEVREQIVLDRRLTIEQAVAVELVVQDKIINLRAQEKVEQENRLLSQEQHH